MDFGRPNGEIGRKMANGQLLFLALGIEMETIVITLLWNRLIYGISTVTVDSLCGNLKVVRKPLDI